MGSKRRQIAPNPVNGEDSVPALTATNQLDELDQKIVRALIDGPRKTDQAHATALGVSARTFSRRRNSEAVRTLLAQALAFPVDELRRMALKGLRRIEDLIDDPDPRISLPASVQLTRLVTQANTFLAVEEDEKASVEVVYKTCWGSATPQD